MVWHNLVFALSLALHIHRGSFTAMRDYTKPLDARINWVRYDLLLLDRTAFCSV